MRGNLVRVHKQCDRVLPYLIQRLRLQTPSHSPIKESNTHTHSHTNTDAEAHRQRETLLVYHCTNHTQAAGEALAFEAAIDVIIKKLQAKKNIAHHENEHKSGTEPKGRHNQANMNNSMSSNSSSITTTSNNNIAAADDNKGNGESSICEIK